jgi:hypothetical protein
LAPKNPNWDLKRDIAKHMELLEHETQKSLIELLRAKLAAAGDDDAAATADAGGDLADAVHNAQLEIDADL